MIGNQSLSSRDRGTVKKPHPNAFLTSCNIILNITLIATS
jgi:hypothetical protein